MPSSVFAAANANRGTGGTSGVANIVAGVKAAMGGRDPSAFAAALAAANPAFAQFLAANKGKTPDQIAAENGIDWDGIRGML